MEAASQTNPLLEVAANLARFHREHERYYSEAPLHEAIKLQRTSRALKALAERWSESQSLEHPFPVPLAGANDLNDDRAIETLGIVTGHIVERAIDILDRIDFSPVAIREDLAGDRLYSRLLFSACELLITQPTSQPPALRSFMRTIVGGAYSTSG